MKYIAAFPFVLCVVSLLMVGFSHSARRQSDSAATPTPQPPYLAVQGENIVALGDLAASANKDGLAQLSDGDMTTLWTAQDVAPQWLSVEFDDFHLVSKIELVVTQSEAGLTTHELWLGDDFHTATPYKQFDNIQTENEQILEVFVDPPRRIKSVYILTRQSMGWVGWYEVRVFNAIEFNEWQLNTIASGFELPVQTTHAGDGSGRLFVVEHKGRIRILKDGVINDAPFLDISDRVKCCGEQGLLGIAFPPTYIDRQHFYVSYTNAAGETVISRFKTSSHPDKADPDSEEILLTIPQPHVNHNGGSIAFGPRDGYLYIGSGDGGGMADKQNGQDPSTLLGKVLRIDVESGVKPYDIPASNPFTEVDGYRDEIWALGIRNPWGFAFDGQTGALYIPDAGQDRREEVNFQSAQSTGGENYGWPTWEGNYCNQFESRSCNVVNVVLPVSVYEHVQGRCAIVGGAVLSGIFMYADFCKGSIWGLQRLGDRWKSVELISGSTAISSIGADEAGNVYAVGYSSGVIYHLFPTVKGKSIQQETAKQMSYEAPRFGKAALLQ